MAYLRAVAAASPGAFVKFALMLPLASHGSRVPRESLAAARLAATLHQDCGSCARIVMREAKRAGVARERLRAMLEGRLEELPRETAVTFRFAAAVAAASPEAGDLRSEVVELHGEAGLIETSLALATAQIFPITKRGLGFARSCAIDPP